MTWFCLVTNPKCERRAEAGLRELGVTTYQPWGRIWSRPKRATGVVMRLRPVFPRYLFVDLAEGREPWFGIRRCDGVAGVVSAAGAPLRLPEPEVLSIWAMETNSLLDFNADPTVRAGEYQLGDQVRLTEGPFAGLMGTVRKTDDGREVEVEMLMFNRHTVTVAKVSNVRRAA